MVLVSTLVEQLRVEAPATVPYVRDLFFEGQDADADGCRTRQEVLLEESQLDPVVDPPCTVTTGQWLSYYDNVLHVDSAAVEMDHLVALKEAWVSGAWSWTDAQRQDYANDLDDYRTLNMVTASVNSAKADKDPASWLPSYLLVRCRYVAEWTAVKWRWNLSVDSAEKSAILDVLAGCDGQLKTWLPDKPLNGQPPSPPLPDAVPVYRFWSPVYQGHFFTTDAHERDQILARWPNIWTYEGQRYTAYATQVAGTVPLYRFWSDQYAGHFYTAQQSERDAVIARWPGIWSYEGIAYYVYPANSTQTDTVSVARFWSETARHHFYTADAAERDGVLARWWRTWTYEGDNFRVPAAGVPTSPAPAQPTVPANPGDTKNCGDFATYSEAKVWFDTYFPYYGDIAKLDGDNNGIPCENLVGAPPR
ncbi:GmrSD restriction endonuclease domain-containing protein [Microbacterium sp.]|uniref:GmrSD restriction endonuclease domain-containing protein n=1 Tax=Microbacterium sp. TaxID=51671 RepID=UPI003C7355AD